MNKEVLDAEISKFCFDIIIHLCKSTEIWTVPSVMVLNSFNFANSSQLSISAYYDFKHQRIVLFQDKLFWNNLANVVAHEWWHAVQWLQDRQISRKHRAFLRHLQKQNTDAFSTYVLEDLSPLEVSARMFESQRKHKDARAYLQQHKYDYSNLLNGDLEGIYHRLKQRYPLLLTDNVKILASLLSWDKA